MKALYLLLCFNAGIYFGTLAQTNYSAIASNRMIQKHHLPEKIKKIAQIDPLRLQVLWNYFTTSFSYNATEAGISVEELLNIQHFDITEYEHLRQPDSPTQFIYRGSIQITLKSGEELSDLLQGYDLNALLNELPSRPFPTWVSTTYTESDFQDYKEQVWDWARDYPEDYLAITSNQNISHVLFSDFLRMSDEKKQEITGNSNYLIVD